MRLGEAHAPAHVACVEESAAFGDVLGAEGPIFGKQLTGAEYLRFIAVSDRDPSIVWTSPTMPVAGLPETPGTIVFIR